MNLKMCKQICLLMLILFKEQQAQYQKKTLRISGVSELSYKTSGGSHSDSVGLVKEVGINTEGKFESKRLPNRSGPERYTDNDVILSDDTRAY